MSVFKEVSRKKSVKRQFKVEGSTDAYNRHVFLTAEYDDSETSALTISAKYQGKQFFLIEQEWNEHGHQIEHSIALDDVRFEQESVISFLVIMKELMDIAAMSKEALLDYFDLN